ncbi:uncharacterized protein CTRU02_211524 [Colletotrichum truncatum]|uniref:Uncharacterized protein n=1 Tax=Colletotrichum truncatum TaxID=5467 RepID=A0ACC3YKY7_COLTU|nr:uncharacterized protein CTRU02_13854 [Colletotrichum truncatum]KAF6782856.1 hypothetical protein CTRU02_13854 [Colletotrichum truncatum]
MRLINAISSLLFLQPLGALACDGYLHCHCYNSDGKPNDVATKAVCDRYSTSNANMIESNPWSDGAKECKYVGPEGAWRGAGKTRGWHAYAFSNCDWRVMCQNAGATGSDSSCRDKPPLGGKSSPKGTLDVPHN